MVNNEYIFYSQPRMSFQIFYYSLGATVHTLSFSHYFLFNFIFCLPFLMFSSKANGIFPSDRNGSLRRDKHNVNKYFYFYQIWRQILKRPKKRCLQTLPTCFLQTIPRRTRWGILSVLHRLIYRAVNNGGLEMAEPTINTLRKSLYTIS